MKMISLPWHRWICAHWAELSSGGRVVAPADLPHPASSGFARPRFALREGQTTDWVAPQADGSRVHLHGYPSGAFVAHRDRVDPSRGMLASLAHFARDTSIGRGLVRAGAVGALLTVTRGLV